MPLSRVSMRQLRAFEAVARNRSYSRAAEELHITQPAVSKQVKLLKDIIGLELVEVVGKRVFLTEIGQQLYTTCGEWLDTWGRFEQAVADKKGTTQGRLRIATVTTAEYFMPRMLGPFCAQYPGIDISMEVFNRDRLLEQLSDNRADFCIMGVPPEGKNIHSEELMANDLVVIASAEHELAQRQNIPLRELENFQFLVREQGSGTRIAVQREFDAKQIELNVRMELGSNVAIKQAVAGNLGLGVLSSSTLHRNYRDELVILDVEGFPIRRAWYAVRPKGKKLSIVAQTFLDFLRQNAHQYMEQRP